MPIKNLFYPINYLKISKNHVNDSIGAPIGIYPLASAIEKYHSSFEIASINPKILLNSPYNIR